MSRMKSKPHQPGYNRIGLLRVEDRKDWKEQMMESSVTPRKLLEMIRMGKEEAMLKNDHSVTSVVAVRLGEVTGVVAVLRSGEMSRADDQENV